MKKIKIYLSALSLIICNYNFGQDSIKHRNEIIIYSVFVNIVPEHFDFPLIGFVNLAKGSHKSADIGFINWNQYNFKGTQISYCNVVGGYVHGAQIGFINTSVDSLNGCQVGFVNTIAKEMKGVQIGFVNTSANKVVGTQVGFVNAIAKDMKGFQLGFVNYADTFDSGLPLGFVSIVRKGGYKAFEICITEIYPVNISFKIGIRKLYTTLLASYNPNLQNKFAIGLGLGSIMPISKSIFFNPELVSQSIITNNNNQQILDLTTNFGYSITPKISILIGPSIIWNYASHDYELNKPLFSLYNNDINEKNKLIVGFRFAIRYNFNDNL